MNPTRKRSLITAWGILGTLALLGCHAPRATIPPPSTAKAKAKPKTMALDSPVKGADSTHAPEAETTAHHAEYSVVDPVSAGMTVSGVTMLCDQHLERAQHLINTIVQHEKTKRTSFEQTFGMLDDALLAVENGSSFPYLMGVAHPAEPVRIAAQRCETKTNQFVTGLWLNPTLYKVLKRHSTSVKRHDPESKRFIRHVLRNFRRGGIELPPASQKRLRSINKEITALGQKFIAAISASRATIRVKKASLRGLPKSYVDAHPADDNGWITISTDYPDYFDFITFSKDRAAARRLFVAFTNRGGDDNVARLDRLFALRHEKATMLGYPTWADFAIEPRMAKTSQAAQAFLERVRDAIRPTALREYQSFVAEAERQGLKTGKGLIPPDRYFLTEQIRRRDYKVDSQRVAEYFEINAVTKGLLDITSEMYGINYRRLKRSVWHPTVRAYEVRKGSKALGTIYLDLFPRTAKYKHAAMFPLRGAKTTRKGQTPIAALVCNFPKPGEPMPHSQVVTYFHEFGHVLHQIFSETKLSMFAGTNTARDFVEAPSQMFEEWAWTKLTLDRFAKHRKSGQPLPDSLLKALRKSRRAGLALSTQRQLFFALLDLAFHTSKPGSDSTAILQRVQKKSYLFRYVKGTHFQSSFGHLISYDAGYYGYQWALSLSHDILGRFQKEGLMNKGTAADWRTNVLSRGGSRDAAELLKSFLGRAANEKAYIKYLQAAP